MANTNREGRQLGFASLADRGESQAASVNREEERPKREARGKAEASKPNPATHELLRWWREQCTVSLGHSYAIDYGRDGRFIKQLLGMGLEITDLKMRGARFMADPYWKRRGLPLAAFYDTVNQWALTPEDLQAIEREEMRRDREERGRRAEIAEQLEGEEYQEQLRQMRVDADRLTVKRQVQRYVDAMRLAPTLDRRNLLRMLDLRGMYRDSLPIFCLEVDRRGYEKAQEFQRAVEAVKAAIPVEHWNSVVGAVAYIKQHHQDSILTGFDADAYEQHQQEWRNSFKS